MSNNLTLPADPWLLEATAQAQLDLVLKQLKNENKTQPFAEFRTLLDCWQRQQSTNPAYANLLEVGCGVAHYGVLLQRWAPRIVYVGTDHSPYMIANSLMPGQVRQVPFEENDFDYDIVLLSQVLEMRDDPPFALEHVLSKLRPGAFLMLHRIRFDKQGARAIYETTYNNAPARNYIWDLWELVLGLQHWGIVHNVNAWAGENVASLLFQKDA